MIIIRMFRSLFNQKQGLRFVRRLRPLLNALLATSLLFGLLPPPLVTTITTNGAPAPWTDAINTLAEALPFGTARAQSSFFTLFIEAEDFTSQSTSTGADTDAWTQVADGVASGGQAMQPLDNDGTIYSTTPDCCDGTGADEAALMTFDIDVPTAGTYYLYVSIRRDNASGSDDSIHTGLNGVFETSFNNLTDDYVWYRTTFTGVSAGVNTINIWQREDGVLVDRLMFSDAATEAEALTGTSATPGHITGTVFRDFDSDGTTDSGEQGVENINVTAYDNTGTAIATTMTDTSGDYTLTGLTDTTTYRLEFTGLPSYLQPSVQGTSSGTSVRFVTSPEVDVDLAVQNPADFCNSNPLMYTSCYVDFGANDYNSTLPAGVSVQYNATGDSPNKTYMVPDADIGATWGVAYHQPSGKLFASSYIRARTTLGPEGSTGAIYEIASDGGTGAISSLFVDLNAEGFDTGDNPHPDATDQCTSAELGGGPSNESCRFHDIDPDRPINEQPAALVGQWGLGDIDFSDNFRTMFAVDLKDKSLIEIPVDAEANQNGTMVEHNLSTYFTDCADSNWQPFGLGKNDGQMYLGVVCTARASGDVTDLDAILYKFDPNSPSTLMQILKIDLDYTRNGKIRACNTGDPGYEYADPCTAEWQFWTEEYNDPPADADDTPANKKLDAYIRTSPNGSVKIEVIHPQPIFSDIEFDGDYVYMALRDRAPDQYGNDSGNPYDLTDTKVWSAVSAGDILCAYDDGTGYQLEQNGDCGLRTSGTNVANQGPGGDEFFDDKGGVASNHDEEGFGSLALLPMSNEIVFTTMNPTVSASSGGLATDSIIDGSQIRGVRLYEKDDGSVNFSKAAGLGDLELICDAAPLEIGNRVWFDEDGDGIQDPDEAVIDGVTVTLHDMDNGGAQVGTATTDANGHYYFGGLSDANMTSGSLSTNRNYEVRISLADAALPVDKVTVPNINGVTDNNNQTDLADSDASASGGNAVIAFATGGAGANNHTLDFGFSDASVRVGNRVWYDANDNGLVDGGELGIDGVLVELLDASDTVTATTLTSGGGLYLFTQNSAGDPLTDGDYRVRIPASNFGDDSTPLKGWRSSTDIALTADPNNDTDKNDNGIGTGSGVDIVSGIVSLAIGSEPDAAVDTDDVNGNLTVDFGFYQAIGAVRINKVTDGEDDIFNFSSDKSNLNGLSITTSGGSGTSGLFTIEPGSYTVTEAVLAGWILNDISCTGDSDDGSTIDVDNRNVLIDLDEGEDIVCTFTNGEEINEVAVEKVLTAPTSHIRLGDTLTYTLRITNTGNVPIDELTLEDVYDSDYLIFEGASVAPDAASEGALTWTATASSGNLQDELPLASGAFITITVNFTATRP